MAKRPIFIPFSPHFPFIKELALEFDWFPGFSKTQSQKSIRSLHKVAKEKGVYPVLEISSKSEHPLGVSLSAFNLLLSFGGKKLSVECAFQGSKVFEEGGPYHDLYEATSIEAKKDLRLKNSGNLISFNFFGMIFPTQPLTAFYDWLYLLALSQNPDYASQLFDYQGFSDIAFNPEKSINCQAKSAALFVALNKSEAIDLVEITNNFEYYLNIVNPNPKKEIGKNPGQLSLFENNF